jgi:hypothetical protein
MMRGAIPKLTSARTSDGTLRTLRQAWEAFRRPLAPERAAALAAHWEGLDPSLRVPFQTYGRGMTGCAATIGVWPGCDLACTACYLSDEARRQPPLALRSVFEQLERIRRWTGPKGNLQVTDGEVTRRPILELVAILRRARELDLIPMLISNGESFRRDSGLLPRLLVEGGLSELCLHIDSTVRGRRSFDRVEREEELDPLREELAGMVRRVRRDTGRPLRVVTTMTVTTGNLAGVSHAIGWYALNRDVFRLVSLQPVATVGRTSADLGPVDGDALWREVARGLTSFADEAGTSGPLLVGHPSCTRLASFVCLRWVRTGKTRFLKIVRHDQEDDRALFEGLADTELLAAGFRDEAPPTKAARIAGALWRARRFVTGPGRRLLARRLAAEHLTWAGVLAAIALGRLRADSFCVVSHHFMDRETLAGRVGKERLANCVFRVPIDGRMASMCEVNNLALREQVSPNHHA